MNTRTKINSNHWLWVVLLVTILLTIWTALSEKKVDEDAQVELAQPDKEGSAGRSTNKNVEFKTEQNIKNTQSVNELAQSTLIPWEKLKREDGSANAKNIFEPHSWAIIPPKPKSGPPPPPVAPPSPFVYMGKVENSPKGTLVLLMANEKLYSVAKGEQIDPFWRLDGEDSNSLQLTFLPLNLPQVLMKTQKAVTSVASPGVATEMNN